jgi:hypothetical protein
VWPQFLKPPREYGRRIVTLYQTQKPWLIPMEAKAPAVESISNTRAVPTPMLGHPNAKPTARRSGTPVNCTGPKTAPDRAEIMMPMANSDSTTLYI